MAEGSVRSCHKGAGDPEGFECGPVASGQDERRAGSRELPGDLAAEAARRADDEDDRAGKCSHPDTVAG